MGEADDDAGTSANHNSFSSDLSASERGDSISGSLHSLSSPFPRNNGPRRGSSLRDMFGSSPGGGSSHGKKRLSSRHCVPILPLTSTDELRNHDEEHNSSFEFGGDHSDPDIYVGIYADPSSVSDGKSDEYAAMSNLDDIPINFENSELFETLELDYVDALQENTKKHSSIRFADEIDLIDDVVRSSNLGSRALDETVLDIFEENKGNTSPTGEGTSLPRYPLYDDNDDESMYDDIIGDEDSMEEEEESEEKKILRGIFYSAGGAAVFAGIGFVAQRLMNAFQNSDDVDVGGADVYHGEDHTGAAADAAHNAELAAEATQIADAAMEASLQASFNTSSSTLTTSGAVGAQGSAAQ